MSQCGGNCGSCGGCAKELTLTQQEVTLLRKLGQIPFLPVARKADDMTPVYLEDNDYTREEYSLILQLLEKKGLITIDYDAPLRGMDMAAYAGYPVPDPEGADGAGNAGDSGHHTVKKGLLQKALQQSLFITFSQGRRSPAGRCTAQEYSWQGQPKRCGLPLPFHPLP